MLPLRRAAVALAVLAAAASLGLLRVTRRALPQVEGRITVDGVKAPIEIVRDRWGVPHVFAQSEEDAAFATGYVHAQDRLFQLELMRYATQGRLAELFGAVAVPIDRRVRTVDLVSPGRRMLREASPETRAEMAAYLRGLNAAAAELAGRLPPEFALLGRSFEPAREDDFLGLLGHMTWGLNMAWSHDPLAERTAARLGDERLAELLPFNHGGQPSVHPSPVQPDPALTRLDPAAQALWDALPEYRASNNWVIGPARSRSGKPLLANDPHLSHALPGIWYELHVHTPTRDVAGVTVPGLPYVVIGHNRRIAWGFTNVMLDAGDFFREKVDLEKGMVMSRGEWVPLAVRDEVIRVKGGADVALKVRSTPHGPLVSELLKDQPEALSYRWNYHAAVQANEIEGFRALGRAANFVEFRAALSRFGAVAQNVVYADVDGHIGLQTVGAIPRLLGQRDGYRFRIGWDGSQEWDGFLPFEENPSTYDPPQGFLASANNPTVPAGFPHYISYHWEPLDRAQRIDEVLRGKDRLSVDDLKALQSDVLLVSAREIVPLLREAYAAQPAPDPWLREALALLSAWDFRMTTDSPAASLFAAFHGRLFLATFEDEMGDLAAVWHERGTVSSVMLRQVLQRGPERWFDRVDTPQVEDRAAILRRALAEAVEGLRRELPGPPSSWNWGRLHTLELVHPFGRASRAAAAYFDLGPLPLPGHTSTVAKAEYEDGVSYRVKVGPSMRQITDLADPAHALSVLPAGQSGIPASPHYADQWALWHAFEYHPLLMDRADIDAAAEGTLTLAPR